jgi:hypothetical protein
MDVFQQQQQEEEEKIFDFKDAKILEQSHPLPYDDRLSEYPSISVIHHAVQDFFLTASFKIYPSSSYIIPLQPCSFASHPCCYWYFHC